MAFGGSDRGRLARSERDRVPVNGTDRSSGAESTSPPAAVKLLISGGFGVGKTTMVGSVSEVAPLRTEEVLTAQGAAVDDLSGVEAKETTTVALDFGRITISPRLIVYLFGTPGQDRFWFMWNELARGALGAVVLADTRRLDSCFSAIDFFERRQVPFVVGVNEFDSAPAYTIDEVRAALDIDPAIPILLSDVRKRESSKQLLVALVAHVMATLTTTQQVGR